MNLSRYFKRLLRERCPGLSGSFKYYGTNIYFPPKSIIFRRACEEGIYEKSHLRIILALIAPGTTYFDVGANIGLLSVPVLSTNPGAHVVSFEASPGTANYLKRTAMRSSYSDRWSIVGKAVGSASGSTSFYSHPPAFGAFDGIVKTGRVQYAEGTTVTIPMTTIDQEWAILAKPIISVIKIDVEGSELSVLQGAKYCIEECKPALLVEWNLANLAAFSSNTEDLLSFANSHSYSIYSILDYSYITNPTVLRLQSLRSDTFLLLPKDRSMPVSYEIPKGFRD